MRELECGGCAPPVYIPPENKCFMVFVSDQEIESSNIKEAVEEYGWNVVKVFEVLAKGEN